MLIVIDREVRAGEHGDTIILARVQGKELHWDMASAKQRPGLYLVEGDLRRRYLTRRTPVIVRLDGRAFHTYTRKCSKPFDGKLMGAMVEAAYAVANEISGFKLAYTQSDEVSFLITDYDELETQAWFGYNQSKVESVCASIMTAHFNAFMGRDDLAYFDARAFNVPENEIANYFLWRAKDWERNSLNMYASAHFTHKQLHGKTQADRHEMLHEIGKNWATDLSARERNSWGEHHFSARRRLHTYYESVAALVEEALEG